MPDNMKVLVIRTDRIGDLILSIPVLRIMKAYDRNLKVGLIASSYAGELLGSHPDIDNLYLLKPDYSNFKEILKEVEKESYSHSVTLHVDKKASWIPLFAKIPVRIGPYSKISSFIKFNMGVFQHRSRSEQNEAQYNLDLLKKLGFDYTTYSTDIIRPTLELDRSPLEGINTPYIVIHPGMGGSALNIPEKTYLSIFEALNKKIPAYMTFGPGDERTYSFFKVNLPENRLLSSLKLSDLCRLYANASLFIGPSTGPMHIASALGTKVFAIFSPIQVQSATRWGPWGSTDSVIFTPEVTCKEKYKCKTNCKFFNCVSNITSSKLIEEIEKIMDL